MPTRRSDAIPRRDFLRVATGLTLSGSLDLQPASLLAAVGRYREDAPRRVEYDLVIDKGNSTTTKLVTTVPAASILAGSVCIVIVTNTDDGSYGEYAALGVTQPSENLFNPIVQVNMISSRRALAAASGTATRRAHFIYAIGGDKGARIELPIMPPGEERAPQFKDPLPGPTVAGFKALDSGNSTGYAAITEIKTDPETGEAYGFATNTGATQYPWGIERFEEELEHRTSDENPANTSVIGRYVLTEELEDRTIRFEQDVSFTSDEDNFYLRFDRRVFFGRSDIRVLLSDLLVDLIDQCLTLDMSAFQDILNSLRRSGGSVMTFSSIFFLAANEEMAST